MDLKSGAIDVAEDLPAAQFEALQKEPGITATAADIRYFVELAMNVYQDQALPRESGAAGRRLPTGAQLGGGQARDRRHLPVRLRCRRAVDHRAGHRRRVGAVGRGGLRLRPDEGRRHARRGRLPGRRRRRRPRGQARRAHRAAPVDAQRIARAAARRQADRRLVRPARLEDRAQRRERRRPGRRRLPLRGGHLRAGLRPVHLGLGQHRRSKLPAGLLHHLPDRGLERRLLVQRRVRPALRAAGRRDGLAHARGAGAAHAADLLRGSAVRRPLLPEGADRLQHRQVAGLGALPGRQRHGRLLERQHRLVRAGPPEGRRTTPRRRPTART